MSEPTKPRGGNTIIKAYMCHGCQICWDFIPGDAKKGEPDKVIQHPHMIASEDATDAATLYSGMLRGMALRVEGGGQLLPEQVRVLREIAEFLFNPHALFGHPPPKVPHND